MTIANQPSQINAFLNDALPNHQSIELITGDASFRKYYRIKDDKQSYILMDAPPPNENKTLFAYLTNAFSQAGINVPEIIYEDDSPQYLLLSDFGDSTLFKSLSNSPQQWLSKCLDTLFDIQTKGGQHIVELPEYDAQLLQQELGYFTTWFIDAWANYSLDENESKQLASLYDLLVNRALNQPKVWVHRDFHCKNLMRLTDDRIGVIDYQDAVYGPITYDLASLLKDCYLVYSQETLTHQLMAYYHQLINQERYWQSYEDFVTDFDFMALQRHIKVLGIFCRLSMRDNKHHYLNDLPRIMNYVIQTLKKHPLLQHYLPLFNHFSLHIKNNLSR